SLNSFFLSTAYLNKKSSLRFNILSGKETTYQAWNGILQETLGKNRTYNSAGTSKPGSPYENETDNYQQDNYQLFFNHQFNGNLSFNTAVFLTRGLGYYEQYKANQSFDTYGLKEPVIGNDTLRKTDLVSQLWLDNYFFGNVFSLQYRKNNSQLTIGGGINRYDGSHFGKIIWSQINIPKDYSWYNLDARKKDASAYVKLQQKLNSYLDAFADIQYRSVNYKLDGFRKNPELLIENRYKFFNPKLGLTFTRKDITGYISYAMSNKEPNRDDFEAGLLKQPRHETLHDLEVGVEKKSDAFLFAATGYYMLYHNQLVLTGQINDVGAYTRTNIPRSYRIGLELQASVKPEPWLYAGGNVTVSRNKVRNFSEFIDDYDNSGQVTYTYDNTDIAFSPTVTASATIGFLPFQNGEISFTNKYVSSQYLDNTSNQSRKLLDFYTLNSRFIYTLKSPLLKEVNLIMQLNNLLDKKYEPNGYTYSYLYGGQLQTENYLFPMAGINWMLGVNISL
ncbi:MAG: TonB-dependent receptor, partial [Chitinophagaceae bacterium]